MAVQYLPPIFPMASSLTSPIRFDGSLSTGDRHRFSASAKSIPCFSQLTADLRGSNSNFTSILYQKEIIFVLKLTVAE